MTHRFIILFLVLASMAQGAISLTPTNVHLLQRTSGGRTADVNLLGSANLWEVWAFNGSGTLTTLTLSEWLSGSGSTIGSANIADGSVALADLANIAQSTLIGRHTASTGVPQTITVGADFSLAGGTLSLANSYQLLDSDLTAIAALTTTSFGRGLLDDADAAAVRSSIETGTTKSGTQLSPTTTNPLSPTWTTQDYTVFYGATGQINLPGVASYTNKTLYLYITGAFTVTVDPSGSEIIVKNGASLGPGVADVITGAAGTFVGYTCDGSRWIRLEGGGAGVAALTPWTQNINGGGFSLSNVLNITAGTITADGAGLTNLPGAALVGPLGDLNIGRITTSEAMIFTPTAGASNVVVTTDSLTTITLDATTETLTYSGTPTTGTVFHYLLTAHTSDCTVTIPSTYSFSTGGNRTTYVVRANKNAYISVFRSASAYYMWGDPVEVGTLPEDTSPDTTAKVEIDQGNGGEFATLASIKTALNLGASQSGTHSAPTTTNPLSVSWSGEFYAVWYGATGEVDLPDAANYSGRGITIYNTGAFTITVDVVDATDVIVRDGAPQSAGVSFTLSSGAGNFVNLISDGVRWITLGRNGTLTVGS
jgi:hypothetical protein